MILCKNVIELRSLISLIFCQRFVQTNEESSIIGGCYRIQFIGIVCDNSFFQLHIVIIGSPCLTCRISRPIPYGIGGVLGLLQQPPNQDKTKWLETCSTQISSHRSRLIFSLHKVLLKTFSNFLG